jgi:dTDP-glucose 4,6-dehydratase
MSKKVLITGGAGFVGHMAIKEILDSTDWEILANDRLSYAGNLTRIDEIYKEKGESSHQRLKFIYHDLKAPLPDDLIKKIKDVNYIIHIGASTHVTKSIENPRIFIEDNIVGSFNLLEASRKMDNLELFYYFSTDEVFGPASNKERFKEWARYNSKNPYSATKAAAEELTIAYANTYRFPALISHCSNVYGERQHHEKFIPNTINKILSSEEIIVHTDSENVPGTRYYTYNEDLAKTILFLVKNYEEVKEKSYDDSKMEIPKVNISGASLVSNLEIVELIAKHLKKDFKYKLMADDPTRPGHDVSYGLDTSLLESLGGVFDRKFEDGLSKTIDGYIKNPEWLS